MSSVCFKLIAVLPMTAAALLLSPSGFAAAEDVPHSKEELSPEVRKKYETLYDELTKTKQQIEQALQDAYRADPALKRAVDEYDRGNRITSKTSTNQRQKVRKYYKDQGPNAYKQFQTWEQCHRKILGMQFTKQLTNNPEMRQIIRFCYDLLTSLERKRAEAEKESPESDRTAGKEQSFEDYLKSFEEQTKKLTEECREYERQLNPPQFVRDYVKEDQYGQVLVNLCDIYITKKTPDSITALRKRRYDLCKQLDDVWSYWRQVEEQKLRQQKAKDPSRQSRV